MSISGPISGIMPTFPNTIQNQRSGQPLKLAFGSEPTPSEPMPCDQDVRPKTSLGRRIYNQLFMWAAETNYGHDASFFQFALLGDLAAKLFGKLKSSLNAQPESSDETFL